MNSNLKNKIDADDKTIRGLLEKQKFYIDYFQREYRWKDKHIKLLIDDLTSAFSKSYNKGDNPEKVANYQKYYLGPVVFSVNPETAKKSIIDGQQRITSITLFLIFLNHLQKDFDEDEKVPISDLIFSLKHRVKSFNMTDKNREFCMKSLFENGSYDVQENDDETIENMVDRYEDIVQSFPDELTKEALPYFIDWFIENVVIVEITAYSDENAYTIFETMNDRGLNLTPTEMLKGYVLSKITDSSQRLEIDKIWKIQIQRLHLYNETADQSFFQAWFRGKYAESIRPGKVGSENKDFELIGSQFHSWFKDNHKSLFGLKNSDEFYEYFKNQFPFYVNWYMKCWDAQREYDNELPHVHYIYYWGIAESLQFPLFLSSININDKNKMIKEKLELVARFIETFTVRRAVNFKNFAQSSIKYTMFNLIKLIRNNNQSELRENLEEEINNIEQKWDGIDEFRLHGQNGKFVKHLLSRISGYLDAEIGKSSDYVSYHHPIGKQFEIEHIWGDKFEEHRDEFEQENDFKKWRNNIGALILLPNGTNQSFNSDNYEDKIEHYIKENTYAQTLHEKFYKKNPNFLNSQTIKDLGFKHHDNFKKSDVVERNKLVQRICEQIWSTNHFSNV